MKKLTIAALAALAMVGAAQAATCNWTISTGSTALTAPSGVTFKDGWKSTTMYTFMGQWIAAAVRIARANLLASLKESQTVSGATKTFTLSNGTLADTAFTVDNQEEGKYYSTYSIVIAEATDGNMYAYFSDTAYPDKSTKDGSGTTSFSVNLNSTTLNDISTTKVPSDTAGWYQLTSDAPEPTSAMLMLLGVAGLCLRRKQK